MSFDSYIRQLLTAHSHFFWDKSAVEAIESLTISTCKISEVEKAKGDVCFITDTKNNKISHKTTRCFDFELNLCCTVDQYLGDRLQRVQETEWLLKNELGTFFINFDLVFFIKNFFLIEEGFGRHCNDKHSRRLLKNNPLHQNNILHRPIVNQIFYCVLAIALGKSKALDYFDPRGHVLPPIVVLSHDCDVLKGNDFFTFSIRILRFIRYLLTFDRLAFNYFVSIFLNLVRPKRFFFDEAVAMADVEQQLGFNSTFYILNGKRGRYGARSGDKLIVPLINALSRNNEIGIHYNYKFAYSLEKLTNQKNSLEELISKNIFLGRAHYLALDSFSCKANLSDVGILVDESYGYSTRNSFISGYAGAFFPNLDIDHLKAPLQVPLSFMDINTVSGKGEASFLSMIADIEKFGGLVTLLFHPGIYNSIEAPALKLKYFEYLNLFKLKKYRNKTTKEIFQLMKNESDGN